ncbi:MAG: efflux RND transporter periplasmic adaptor subunit [Gemmatimonadota bacterium]|nr:MAG: efflux RND transporter periplasmic adaptor subunit [Gemmatimonadota bacterium]
MTIKRQLTRGWVSVLAGIVLAGCDGDAQAGNGESDDALVRGASRVINVEVTSVGTRDFVRRIRLTGTVWADQDVRISAEESGVIREIIVDKGSRVSLGQALLKIDDRVLTSQVAEATARAALARETWERRKRLFEEDRVGSELAYLEAKYGADQAVARLATLQERLARTVVRAPIAGVLEDRMVEVGTMVNTGTPVARIVSLDLVKVVAGVPERYAPEIRIGSAATVYFDVLADGEFEEEITFVGATVNPSNRTFLIEIEMANPGGVIKPEMVANIEVVRGRLEDVVVIPQEALVRVESGFVVFVVTEEGGREVAEVRAVSLGPSQGNEVVVEGGLDPGDKLITVGQKEVVDGDRLNVVASW